MSLPRRAVVFFHALVFAASTAAPAAAQVYAAADASVAARLSVPALTPSGAPTPVVAAAAPALSGGASFAAAPAPSLAAAPSAAAFALAAPAADEPRAAGAAAVPDAVHSAAPAFERAAAPAAPAASRAVETPRGAGLSALFDGAAARAANDRVFSNAWVSSREIRRRLGFDPLFRPRAPIKLSGPKKGNVDIFQLRYEPFVVKIADKQTVTRELALRVLHEMFADVFAPFFDMPPVLAVSVGFPLSRQYLVMPKVDGSNDGRRAASLPPSQRPALAAFALTFGFMDMNEGALLFHHRRARSAPFTLIDAERAGERWTLPSNGRPALMMEPLPWLDHRGRNDLADYLPFIARWTERLERPGSWDEIAARLRASGLDASCVGRLIANFRANARSLELILASQIRHVNGGVEVYERVDAMLAKAAGPKP